MIRLAQYQPEIPQNAGTLLRTCACLGIHLDIIDPCGFGLSDARLKRAGMDYLDLAHYQRHINFEAFRQWSHAHNRRLVYLTPHAPTSYLEFAFSPQDTVILGRESSGIPAADANLIPLHLSIPMVNTARSMNVAMAGGMVLGEAIRQVAQMN